VIYGAEAWSLTNKMEKLLMTWERKILRKLYGPTHENGHWGIIINFELEDKYKSKEIFFVKGSKTGMACTYCKNE
jgi:hypothetical protein